MLRIKNCGIINLDGKNGPGTHWACYIRDFYFDPFGLPPPESVTKFIPAYNDLQYQKKESVLCGYFCLFFIKMFQEGNSIHEILYKILDPKIPRKNEEIMKTYFINYGNIQ